MGEMADYYMEQDMMENLDEYIEDMYKEYERSPQLQHKMHRYAVTDEQIKDFLFRISVKHLCELTDNIIMNRNVEELETEASIEKMIDIAAWGLSRKQLSNKQLWCLGSFCLYYIKELDL